MNDSQPSELDRLRNEIQVFLLEKLAAAIRLNAKLPLTAAARDNGFQAVFTVGPVPPFLLDPNLTDCERDIIAVLHQIPNPATTCRILDALEERSMLHGESTVKHALPSLAKRGWVIPSRKAPRGYTLTRRPAAEAAESA
jgi:hypothetical protein